MAAIARGVVGTDGGKGGSTGPRVAVATTSNVGGFADLRARMERLQARTAGASAASARSLGPEAGSRR